MIEFILVLSLLFSGGQAQIVIHSQGATRITQYIDTDRFQVAQVEATSGDIAVPDMFPHDAPPPMVLWAGSEPATITITLDLLDSAPLGDVGLRSTSDAPITSTGQLRAHPVYLPIM